MVITAKQLRTQISDVLKKVRKGGVVTVTLRGKPVAKLVAFEAGKERDMLNFPAFGMWAGRKDMRDPVAWVNRIRKPRYRFH